MGDTKAVQAATCIHINECISDGIRLLATDGEQIGHPRPQRGVLIDDGRVEGSIGLCLRAEAGELALNLLDLPERLLERGLQLARLVPARLNDGTVQLCLGHGRAKLSGGLCGWLRRR